jgi:nitroreductase
VEFSELVRKRRSIRAYREDPIEDEKLDQILEAVQGAPSAGNLQAFEVYVVESKAMRRMLSSAALNQTFIQNAALSLVFCTNPGRNIWKYSRRGELLYAIQDAAIACTYAMLAAVDLGLSTVWIGAFDENEVRLILSVPNDWRPVSILVIGHGIESGQRNTRRALDDFVHFSA